MINLTDKTIKTGKAILIARWLGFGVLAPTCIGASGSDAQLIDKECLTLKGTEYAVQLAYDNLNSQSKDETLYMLKGGQLNN